MSTDSVAFQFHAVYDDLHSNVTCPVDALLPESSWNTILSFEYEKYLVHDETAPPLASEWLSPEEIADNQRKFRHSQDFGYFTWSICTLSLVPDHPV